MSRKDKIIKRGDVYWTDLNPTIGSEINKIRPAIIISNEVQNELSSRVIVIPITSNTSKLYPFEAKIKLEGNDAKAMADQIRTIDKSRLKQYISTLTKSELKDIEKAIKISLSLE
jgi:mRNA interferase MazF